MDTKLMYVLIAIIVILLITLLANTIIYKKKLSNITKSKFTINDYISIGNGESLLSILDTRIEDVLNTYVILNFAYKESLYISQEIQDEMNNDILIEVIRSLSYDYLDILKIIYDGSVIKDEIKRRVELAVMSYVIEVNGKYTE